MPVPAVDLHREKVLAPLKFGTKPCYRFYAYRSILAFLGLLGEVHDKPKLVSLFLLLQYRKFGRDDGSGLLGPFRVLDGYLLIYYFPKSLFQFAPSQGLVLLGLRNVD